MGRFKRFLKPLGVMLVYCGRVTIKFTDREVNVFSEIPHIWPTHKKHNRSGISAFKKCADRSGYGVFSV